MPGIPVSALGFVCPVTAAVILVWRESGAAGVRALLERSFDYRRIPSKLWYAPVLLLMPAVTVLFLIFFIAALGEELGWSGYAIDPMQARYGALRAAILLGIVWAVWHIVAMVQGASRRPGSPGGASTWSRLAC
jgi:membrane protease YdiL (CAAX protease family)